MKKVLFLAFLFTCFSFVGCKKEKKAFSSKKPIIVATTTMIGDMARQIAGEHTLVIDLMKPGVDPHTYDPRPQDMMYFRRASLILVNGLHLEGKMLDMIKNAGSRAVKLAEQKAIVTRKASAGADPHVWWDVRNFMAMTQKASKAFIKLLPTKKQQVESATKTYLKRLKKLHQESKALIQSIPKERRLMVTSHDAFFYFGAAYQIEVDAVIGISTDAQARAAIPLKLAGIITKRNIPAIFHETSVSKSQNALVDSIKRLAWMKHKRKITIAGPLYSDSLGERKSFVGNYIGAFKANVRMVYEALSGKKAPAYFRK